MIVQHKRLVEDLADRGLLLGRLLTAYEQVPRHLFVPSVAWFGPEDDLRSISRDEQPDEWLDACYQDLPIVTQFDDGAVPLGGSPGLSPTSSLSMPSIQAQIMEAANVEVGMRLLDCGTGSGWGAALWSVVLGEANVYSVEVDTGVMLAAQRALANAGFAPRTRPGDAGQGCPDGAMFDRIVATFSVYDVPHAWIGQTRPGGVVVTPWRTPLFDGQLLRLHVNEDATASGRFVGDVSFMVMRSQRLTVVEVPRRDGEQRLTFLHSGDVFNGAGAHMAAALKVPNAERWTEYVEDGYVSRIDDPASGSWSSVEFGYESSGPYTVTQGGPRRLWDEVEKAFEWWHENGSPELDRFGVTVAPGRQAYWLDEPSNSIFARGL